MKKSLKMRWFVLMGVVGSILLPVVLTGCGAETAGGAKPEEVYEAIKAVVKLPAMVEMPDTFIADYYGIDLERLDGYVFAVAEDPVSAETIVLIKANQAGDAEVLAGQVELFVKQKLAEMENYQIPEQYQIVADSRVEIKGAYVYLVISEQAGEIESVIQSALE